MKPGTLIKPLLREVLYFPWVLLLVYVVGLIGLYTIFGNNLQDKLTQGPYIITPTRDVVVSFVHLTIWLVIMLIVGVYTRVNYPRTSTLISTAAVVFVLLFSILYFPTLRLLLNLE